MKAIKSSAVSDVIVNILERIKQECIKLFGIRPLVVLYRHTRAANYGTIIRRICYTDICFLSVKHRFDIFGLGSVTAEKSVFSEQPNIARLNKRFCFKSFINIEFIICGIFFFITEKVGKLRFIKTYNG